VVVWCTVYLQPRWALEYFLGGAPGAERLALYRSGLGVDQYRSHRHRSVCRHGSDRSTYRGSLGKLYAKTLEEVPRKPVEALRALGAGPFQLLWWGLWPQAKRMLASYTIVRWETNIRGLGHPRARRRRRAGTNRLQERTTGFLQKVRYPAIDNLCLGYGVRLDGRYSIPALHGNLI